MHSRVRDAMSGETNIVPTSKPVGDLVFATKTEPTREKMGKKRSFRGKAGPISIEVGKLAIPSHRFIFWLHWLEYMFSKLII